MKGDTVSISKVNLTKTLESVASLLKEDKTLSPQVKAMMELLVMVIHLLMAKLGLNSKNSSLPPSQDPNRERLRSTGKTRKPGGQPGHPGRTLEKEKNPDIIKELPVDRTLLPEGEYKRAGFETRQVIDIEISKVVTEYRAEILVGANGRSIVAPFPEGVTKAVQYGDSVKAHAVYMSIEQLMPYERLAEYFENQCGIGVSTGSLVAFNAEAYAGLERFESITKSKLAEEEVLHSDETGINLNGKRFWLHTLCNGRWTLFYPHAKRGSEAMMDIGVLEHFKGILIHDHWKAYFKFNCLHSLCNAHHLRELERAFEQDKQEWAKNMKDLLIEMSKAKNRAQGEQIADIDAAAFVARYRAILELGDVECPAPEKKAEGKRGKTAKSKSRNLLERLANFETETLRFLFDRRVPFTNNQGERDIRMTKVQQKISGCFKSLDGAKTFCRVRGYLSTCKKHGINPTDALKILFQGKLPEFIQGPP
jgi:transposase